MSCLAASSATPPASRPTSQRLFVAVAAPSRWRSIEPHRALWRNEGPRVLTMLRRCSSAGDSRAAGDGSLSSFCIIEGPETIQDFVQMQTQEIQDNIKSRRSKIFLLMEERSHAGDPSGKESSQIPPAPARAQRGFTMVKNFRKRSLESDSADNSDDEDTRRVALEEIKYMQKLRERKLGIPAASVATGAAAAAAAATDGSSARSRGGSGAGAAGEEDLVLQDTFAQETAVTIEDPNMLRYVENELLKKRGKEVEVNDKDDKDQVDELYVVPDHLKVRKKNMEESSTQWTTGIAEVQLPIEYKLRNIEETEAAKKMLQERRLAGKTKSDANIPSSYSADFFHRGRDYAEKLRREHPELCKGQDSQANETGGKPTDSNNPGGPPAGRREAATDELLLERFRKREKFRVMRR